jgi:hypothetical protein
MNKTQFVIIALILLSIFIILVLNHLYPSKDSTVYRQATINTVLSTQDCKVVERIFNDNNSFLGDGVILQAAKLRLDSAKFMNKDCLNPAWNK